MKTMEKLGTSKSLWISTVRMCRPVREAFLKVTAESSISATEEPHIHKLALEDSVAKAWEFRRDAAIGRHKVVSNRNKLAKSGQLSRETWNVTPYMAAWLTRKRDKTRNGTKSDFTCKIASKLRLTTHICTATSTSTRRWCVQFLLFSLCLCDFEILRVTASLWYFLSPFSHTHAV